MNYLMTRNNALSNFDSFFDDMITSWGIRNSSIPTVDVMEDEKAFYLEAELAGYDEKDIKLDLDNNILHLSSEKSHEERDRKKYLVRERNYVRFDRSFSLPDNVDKSNIEAQFKNGILTVTLPKLPAEEKKRISISFKH